MIACRFALGLFACSLVAQTPTPVPYTLTFVPSTPAGLPAMHSYCIANVSPTQWLILGGRLQGLHTFNPAGNFAGPNTFLWSIDPTIAKATKLADLTHIAPAFSDPLMATNQECEYRADTGDWYIVGGYGLSRPTKQYLTFPTITRISVPALLSAVNGKTSRSQTQSAVAKLLSDPANQVTNPAMKVTGGSLSHMASGLEFLAFGQIFDGQYNPFSSGGFTQTYTQNVLPFSITLNPFAIRTLSPITSSSTSAPFNRRDFAAVYDVDPATQQPRFAIFGGVFQPGAIKAYDYPVYITGAGTSISVAPDQSVSQHFGNYEAPVVVVWDGSSIYHTFFGGISHYFLNQSAAQAQVYQLVSRQGRNDGLPFVADIATLMQDSTGKYQEFVSQQPIPDNLLHGASVDFLANLAMASKFQNSGEVVNLQSFTPGEKELIGYIFGGIEARFPLPCIPSHGTVATNTIYQVFLTRAPWPGLVPASQATEANGDFSHTTPGAVANPCGSLR